MCYPAGLSVGYGPVTLCQHPLLKILEQTLTGRQIGRRTHPIKVVAYADNVTIFVSSVTDFAAVEEAFGSTNRPLGRVLTRPSQEFGVWRMDGSGDRTWNCLRYRRRHYNAPNKKEVWT